MELDVRSTLSSLTLARFASRSRDVAAGRAMPYDGSMQWLLTANPGLEDVVAAEAAETVDARVRDQGLGMRGRVVVETDAPSEQLERLRSPYHVARFLGGFRVRTDAAGLSEIRDAARALEVPEMASARAFRVTGQRSGDHAYTSIDLQHVVGQALVDRYGTAVDLETYDVDLRCDVIGRRCELSVRSTDASLHRQRFDRPFDHPAGTKAPLAYALLRLADVRPGETLLDPFCGGGTIAIEAAQAWPDLRVIAGDVDPSFLEGARQNAEAAGVGDRITLREMDARGLTQYLDAPVDRIVANPPYGIRMGKTSYLKGLYSGFLQGASQALTAHGRVVVMTPRAETLRRALFALNGLTPLAERNIRSGGLYPVVFTLAPL